ncbi:MAG: EAL domain-containing protein [Gammaproteobacteria bacterium]|nr:EAL domain-containing protein [Gammaproteobacteria bacterium]
MILRPSQFKKNHCHKHLLQSTLVRLKETGIKLSLDDFGTGFSSLSYLQQYPLDVLKIDRAFVKKMSDKSDTKMIVKAIISMAKTMNLKVVAGGGDTLEQVATLQKYQCTFSKVSFILSLYKSLH